MLEVYLVRHGKTVFNTIGRLQGWSDSPLTDEGRAAAAALGCRIGKRKIAFDAAFSSTAPRAAETAGLILQQAGQGGLAVRQLPDLREYCFGGFEGEFTHVLYQKLAEQNGFPDAAAFQTASPLQPRKQNAIKPHKTAHQITNNAENGKLSNLITQNRKFHLAKPLPGRLSFPPDKNNATTETAMTQIGRAHV